MPKKKHKQTELKPRNHNKDADDLLFHDQLLQPDQQLRQGTPQVGRKQLDKKKSSNLDSSRNADSSVDGLNSARSKKDDKAAAKQQKQKKPTQAGAAGKERGAGIQKKRIGMLMKESHSIFKLDEKQKELMHKLKQEDREQKGPSKDFSHLKKKQDKRNTLKKEQGKQKMTVTPRLGN